MSEQGLARSVELLRADNASADAIAVFERFYRQLESGATGLIRETEIEPVRSLPELASLEVSPAAAREAFAKTAVIKLNGGLATSMGLDRAKTLLPVKDGLTFLDIIVRQVRAQRDEFGVTLPLVFMNSFRTQRDTLDALAPYRDLAVDGLPVDFLQSREPKLLAEGLAPANWPADPEVAWCPPGHGDLYPALRSSGVLDSLIERGFRYAFCSNSDNLGAVAEPRIAGWLAANDIPFVLESCVRTPADRKGGHLAVRKSDGRLVLRETAQTSPDDLAGMQDLDRHSYCNSNNLWLDLLALKSELDAHDGVLDLPLIRNVKSLDPRDGSTPPVVQIESAMGAAVQSFAGARSVLVDRSRFVPVKTTNDLLVLRSDLYDLDGGGRLVAATGRVSDVDAYVDLDPAYYKLIDDFEARFPDGPPSLARCESLVVRGDVRFGGSITVTGRAAVTAADGLPRQIEAGSVLNGDVQAR